MTNRVQISDIIRVVLTAQGPIITVTATEAERIAMDAVGYAGPNFVIPPADLRNLKENAVALDYRLDARGYQMIVSLNGETIRATFQVGLKYFSHDLPKSDLEMALEVVDAVKMAYKKGYEEGKDKVQEAYEAGQREGNLAGKADVLFNLVPSIVKAHTAAQVKPVVVPPPVVVAPTPAPVVVVEAPKPAPAQIKPVPDLAGPSIPAPAPAVVAPKPAPAPKPAKKPAPEGVTFTELVKVAGVDSFRVKNALSDVGHTVGKHNAIIPVEKADAALAKLGKKRTDPATK